MKQLHTLLDDSDGMSLHTFDGFNLNLADSLGDTPTNKRTPQIYIYIYSCIYYIYIYL